MTSLLFCQNDSLKGESFWQKNRLVTHILFDLCLFEHFSPVANFEQQSICWIKTRVLISLTPAWPDPTQFWTLKAKLNPQLVMLVSCSNHSKILDSRCMSCVVLVLWAYPITMAMLFSFAVIYRLHYRSHQSSIRRRCGWTAPSPGPTVSYF